MRHGKLARADTKASSRAEAITVQAPLIDWDLEKHACGVDVWLRNIYQSGAWI